MDKKTFWGIIPKAREKKNEVVLWHKNFKNSVLKGVSQSLELMINLRYSQHVS